MTDEALAPGGNATGDAACWANRARQSFRLTLQEELYDVDDRLARLDERACRGQGLGCKLSLSPQIMGSGTER